MSASDHDSPEPLSKTKRKKSMIELQSLGEEMVSLSPDRLRRIDLPDDLRSAINTAQGMRRHDGARRRQLQYIGRLMREVDVEPVRLALAAVRGDSASEIAKLHRLEKLRDELLADEQVLSRLLAEMPGIDLQQLRALRRAALLEQAQGKPPRRYRELFQFLKANILAEQSPLVQDEEHAE
ncbi:MAG TPA: ribosome biogenesis factor YjgA [Accumulibacter sp.]|nr:ribosome biogenesis factor YjgA [Accumulibacter sp.]HMW19053.1 ribosome biogenesis factor YjgA [Accumulibacter sp.]HMX23778.1 ribosome biogenesis factor YjgA [Accumulibacter sp.]HMY06521.1 ribosome biogenesis factor YjgA [Accumulibacter sp.]HNC18978.1 ribosome biogenesis factor YjgA [Accumulibacter sp.]